MAILFTILTPSFVFAASTEPTLGDTLKAIYAGTAEEISAIVNNDELTSVRKFQTISNVLKTRHDTAMNSIRNLK